MDTSDVRLESRWAAAIRDKVFSSNSYEMTLPDGTVLQGGDMRIYDPTAHDPTIYDPGNGITSPTVDDAVFRDAFKHKLQVANVRIVTMWKLPGICLRDVHLEDLFAVNKTMAAIDLFSEGGLDMMFRYKAKTKYMERYGKRNHFHLIDDKAWMCTHRKGSQQTQKYDINTDLVYDLSRMDLFSSEFEFLNVYGAHKLQSVLGG